MGQGLFVDDSTSHTQWLPQTLPAGTIVHYYGRWYGNHHDRRLDYPPGASNDDYVMAETVGLLFAAEMATWRDRKYESWGDGFDFKAACCVHSGRLQAAKGPEKEKVRQEVTPSMRANLIRIIGRYHSHVLPARGGADASTTAGTASTAAASTDAAAD